MATSNLFERTVFINCPFGDDYVAKLHAIIFVVLDCGLRPSLASQISDSDENRLSKIATLVRNARFGIHDISVISLSGKHKYPRFNMPFELGLHMGASRFEVNRRRRLLILEGKARSYLGTLSDIRGQDAQCHRNTIKGVIERTRNFFSGQQRLSVAGAEDIRRRFSKFKSDLPTIAAKKAITKREVESFDYLNDYIGFAENYLETLKRVPALT